MTDQTLTLKKGDTVITGVNPDKVDHYVSYGWVVQEAKKAPAKPAEKTDK